MVLYGTFACVSCMARRRLTSTAQHVQLQIQVPSGNSIPVRRWGSFKLRHRTVLTDWGVQATHFLKQKARLQQSWQNMKSRYISIYGIYIDFLAFIFFPNKIMNCSFNSSVPSWKLPPEAEYLKKPWFFFFHLFFLSGIVPDKPRYHLGLWNHTAAVIFCPTKGSCKVYTQTKRKHQWI